MNSSLFLLNFPASPQRWLLGFLVALLPLLGWGQTLIARQDFETTPTTPAATVTLANGTFYTTTAGTNDRPALADFYSQGKRAYGITNGTATITSSTDIDASSYTNISLSFRLASFSIGSTTNGADTNDLATLAISTDGGVSYVNQVIVGGNSNAYWSFTSGTGTASRAYAPSAAAPNITSIMPGATGGSRTNDGYSLVTVTGIPSTARLRFRITLLNNASAERWLVDDLQVAGTLGNTDPNAPSLTTMGTLTAFTTPIGTPSAAQSYTLNGSNLTTDVAVTAPAGYEVSQTSATTGFAASQTVAQTSGSAAATIYVRLTGAAAGTFAGNVVNATDGATQNVAVAGTTTGLTVSPAGLSAFTTPQSAASAAQTYTLMAAGLSGSVTVVAPGGYQVAQSATTATTPGTYAATQTVTQANASAGRTLYVRLTGAAAGTYSGNVTNAATGVATQNVAVTGTVGAPAPSLTASATSLAAFNTLAGAPSAARTYTLTGRNLTADVTVAAPAGYEVSQTSATADFAGSQTLTPTDGSVAATIFVRLAGTTAGTASGSITNASPGATTLAVALASTVVGKPTAAPTIAVGTPTFESASLSLGAADGTNLLVVVRPAASPATAPTDQAAYSGSLTYGAGTTLGAGFVVLAAANTPAITVTGLSESTAYVADVYTYNLGTVAGFESYGVGSATAALTTPAQPPAAPGMLLAVENFDYPSGTVLATSTSAANATTGWTAYSGNGTNNLATVAGNQVQAQYPQGVLAATPAGTSTQVALTINGQDIYKPFAAPTVPDRYYVAAVVNISTAQSAGDYFLNLYDNTSGGGTMRGRVFVRATASGGINFGVSVDASSSGASYSPTVYNLDTPYLVVLRYETNGTAKATSDDVATLYVLDNSATPVNEPTAPTATAGPSRSAPDAPNFLNAVALRQGSRSGSDASATLLLDGLRVATGWGGAVGRPVYTAASTIMAGDYYSLRVAGVGTQVSTSGVVRLEKQLNLDGGQVVTTTASPLVLRARPIVGDGFEILINPGGTSFVDGPVAREAVGGPSLLFPIGRNGNYRPLTLNITSPPSGTTTYTAVQTESAPAAQTLGEPLARVSQVRYFSVTPSPVPAPGVFTGTVSLSFGTDDQVTDPSQPTFVVAKSDGAGWASIGRGVNTTTSLTSDTFQDFSDFSLASTAADVTVNPLPVQLTSLAATRTASGVQVTWATASELNSARFEVERSPDGLTFGRVASVLAQGTTNQAHRYTALDRSAPASLLYYRLRQVDRDGTVAYSPTVAVATGGGVPAEFTLAPNPTRASLTFLTEAPAAYTVRTPLGQAVRTGTTRAGTNTLAVDELPAGVYLFELHGPQGRVVRRFIKE